MGPRTAVAEKAPSRKELIDSVPGRMRRTSPRLRALATSIFLIVASLFLIPWNPGAPPDGLDRAWELALHVAFLRELAFGRDLIFSFGPWGFLWRGYHPSTYAMTIFGWAFFSFVFVESLWRISTKTVSRPVSMLVISLAVGVVLSKGGDALLMALPVLWYFTARDRALSVRFFFLTIATALAVLGKFSLFLFLIPLAVLLAIDEMFRLRRAPVSVLAFTAGVLGWWLLAGQHPNDLLPFLRNSLDLASGYGEAMSLEHQGTDRALLPLFIVGSALLFSLPILARSGGGYPWPGLDVIATASVVRLK